eukprot:5852072-Lingulodinium_polyedra.AAC.1
MCGHACASGKFLVACVCHGGLSTKVHADRTHLVVARGVAAALVVGVLGGRYEGAMVRGCVL